MRTKLPVGAALLALAALAAALAPAALSGDGGREHRRFRLIELTATVVQEAQVDVAPLEQPSVGDAFVFSDELRRDGTPVGDSGGSCTVVRIDEGALVASCAVTLRLAHGQLALQGLATFPEAGEAPFTLAVTGGTGAFRTAHGDVEVTPVAEGTNRLAIRLIR